MATDPLEALRLTVMQDVLPVGMAVVDRVRREGPRGVVDAFTSSEDPLAQLREEGDAAASQLRESLDRLQPGLGNPVMKVQVREMDTPMPDDDRLELQRALGRISEHLALLEQRLTPPA